MTTVTQATGLFAPHGLAVDANQNLYIANSGEKTIVELPATPTGFSTEITLPISNLNYPQGVAVDGGGNVYVVDSSISGVIRLPWSGTAFGTPTTLSLSGLGNATGLAVDGAGSLYIIDAGNSQALKLDLQTPPSLSFKSTNVGSVSSDSPQSVSVTNIGNKSLTFLGSQTDPNYPANFPENTADTSLCTSGTPVTQGATCDVSVNFKPTASGALTGTVVLTDNTLNVANSTQSISVSGNGVGAPTAATPVITPGTGSYTSNQTVTITDATAGATIYYSTDGSTPTVNSNKYTAAFLVSRTGTIVQAIAVASGFTNSAIAQATSTLNAIAPVLAPPGGTYNGPQSVTLTTATSGAQIYFTTNGIAPTTESTQYTAPISVTVSGMQIQAIAALSGYNNSPVASGTLCASG